MPYPACGQAQQRDAGRAIDASVEDEGGIDTGRKRAKAYKANSIIVTSLKKVRPPISPRPDLTGARGTFAS